MASYIDTHAHLDASIYENDLEVVLKHAKEHDVATITVGNDFGSSVRAVEIAQNNANVYAAIGVHPSRIRLNLEEDQNYLNIDGFAELANHPKVVAIGETGLDFHDLHNEYRHSPHRREANQLKENQKKVFGRFLGLAQEKRLPLLLHCRDAYKDMLQMLETWDRATPGYDSRGIVHGFNGTWKDARRYFNLEFLVSVTGTMAHGAYQTEIIRKAPLSRLVLESDCPHLTPESFSSRRNEPSYLPVLADAVASIRGITRDEVAQQTTSNCRRMFRKMHI